MKPKKPPSATPTPTAEGRGGLTRRSSPRVSEGEFVLDGFGVGDFVVREPAVPYGTTVDRSSRPPLPPPVAGTPRFRPPWKPDMPVSGSVEDRVQALEDGRLFTPEEYVALVEATDDGRKYEFIDGVVYVSPSPAIPHIIAARNLAFLLSQAVNHHRAGQVLIDPWLWLADHIQLIPDILWVTPEHLKASKETQIIGPPRLVVEVLSPGTRSYDRGLKRTKYKERGVKEYWRVDPKHRVVEVDYLDRHRTRKLVGDEKVLRTMATGRRLPGWHVTLAQVFNPYLEVENESQAEQLRALEHKLVLLESEGRETLKRLEQEREREREARVEAERAAKRAAEAAKRAEKERERERQERMEAERAAKQAAEAAKRAELEREQERRARAALEEELARLRSRLDDAF